MGLSPSSFPSALWVSIAARQIYLILLVQKKQQTRQARLTIPLNQEGGRWWAQSGTRHFPPQRARGRPPGDQVWAARVRKRISGLS